MWEYYVRDRLPEQNNRADLMGRGAEMEPPGQGGNIQVFIILEGVICPLA